MGAGAGAVDGVGAALESLDAGGEVSWPVPWVTSVSGELEPVTVDPEPEVAPEAEVESETL